MITSQQLWFSNLKIVRASNLLTISGTVVKAGPVANINLRIFNTSAVIEPNRVFTLVSSIKDVVRCTSDTRVNRTGGNIWYYKKGEHGKDIRIADIVATSNTQVDMNRAAVWVYPDVATYGENFTFSITFYDIACYYGAFTNPPALKSPDVLLSNVFEVSGTAMRNVNTLKTSKIGWFRLLRWYAGIYYDTVNHTCIFNRIHPHRYYFTPGYHAQSASSDTYDTFHINCGFVSSYYAGATKYNVMVLEVTQYGQKVGAYTKFRLARGTDILYKLNQGSTVNRYWYYDVYLEAYYTQNVGSDVSRVYADNLINTPLRIDNVSGNPDGNDDILIGSEVVPTLAGTAVTVPL